MKIPRALSCLAVVFLGAALASCGFGPGGPGPNQSSPAPSTGECAAFLPEAPCGTYTSNAGSDDGAPLPWVKAGEVTATLAKRGGDTYLTAVLPCGPLDAVVTITGTTMRLTGQRALGASGCIESVGERQAWVLEFFEGGVELAYSDSTLTWTNDDDSLSFAAP